MYESGSTHPSLVIVRRSRTPQFKKRLVNPQTSTPNPRIKMRPLDQKMCSVSRKPHTTWDRLQEQLFDQMSMQVEIQLPRDHRVRGQDSTSQLHNFL